MIKHINNKVQLDFTSLTPKTAIIITTYEQYTCVLEHLLNNTDLYKWDEDDFDNAISSCKEGMGLNLSYGSTPNVYEYWGWCDLEWYWENDYKEIPYEDIVIESSSNLEL